MNGSPVQPPFPPFLNDKYLVTVDSLCGRSCFISPSAKVCRLLDLRQTYRVSKCFMAAAISVGFVLRSHRRFHDSDFARLRIPFRELRIPAATVDYLTVHFPSFLIGSVGEY